MNDNKTSLLILGSHHLANPSLDMANVKTDDVLAPKRQSEIKQIVQMLAQFNPTKVAIEIAADQESEIQKRYQNYLQGHHTLARNESEQIGFRVAKAAEHNKIYPVDWNKPSADPTLIDFPTFAKSHNQTHLLEAAFTKAQASVSEIEAIQKTSSLIDVYRFQNNLERLCEENKVYYQLIAQIGTGDQYTGAEWVQYWYGRNLKIFVNLCQITELEKERILLIIGTGHVYHLRQIAEDSGLFNLENLLNFLG